VFTAYVWTQMVVNTILAIGGALVLGAIIANLTSRMTFLAQTTAMILLSVTLLRYDVISILVGGVIISLPVVIRVFAFLWYMRIGRKVINGDYGEEARWAAELAKDGDEEFKEAFSQISEMEAKEIGIVVDDKDEMRQAVIDRAETDE
jgi:hypothetical protein